MKKQAVIRGFGVDIGDYAFSYRAEYDDNGQLQLPAKYIDNTDRNIISNQIYAVTFPSVASWLSDLQETRKKLVIWGWGNTGKLAYKILRKKKIPVAYIIDQDEEVRASVQIDIPAIAPGQLKGEMERTEILLASADWKKMLKYINDCRLTQCMPVILQKLYRKRYVEEQYRV